MSQANDWREMHPIGDDVFSVAYNQHAEPDRDAEFYHERLASIQQHLELEKLKTYLTMGRPDQHPAIETVDTSENGYAFVNHQGGEWKEIFDELAIYDGDVREFVASAHRKQIVMTRAEITGPPEEVEWLDDDGDWEGFVIGASKVWRDAEQSAQDFLQFLVYDADCTAAEALDYFMCERHDMEQTMWAYWRGVDQSAVNKNVAQAREKIETEVLRPWEEPDISEEQERARKEYYEQAERELQEGTDE